MVARRAASRGAASFAAPRRRRRAVPFVGAAAKAKHHRGGAQRAAAARRLVPARDVSLGRATGSPTSLSSRSKLLLCRRDRARVASRPRAHGTCAGAQPRYLSQTRAIEGKNSLFLGGGPANIFALALASVCPAPVNSNPAVTQRRTGHVTVRTYHWYFNEKEIRTEEAVKSAQRSAANTESCQATADYFALR